MGMTQFDFLKWILEGGLGSISIFAGVTGCIVILGLVVFWKILKHNCFFHQTAQMSILASIVLKNHPEKLRAFKAYARGDVPGKKKKALIDTLLAI